jgi:hypothetical protein
MSKEDHAFLLPLEYFLTRTGVVDTGDKWKKASIGKVLIILFGLK